MLRRLSIIFLFVLVTINNLATAGGADDDPVLVFNVERPFEDADAHGVGTGLRLRAWVIPRGHHQR